MAEPFEPLGSPLATADSSRGTADDGRAVGVARVRFGDRSASLGHAEGWP